jgi:hypothetical protein
MSSTPSRKNSAYKLRFSKKAGAVSSAGFFLPVDNQFGLLFAIGILHQLQSIRSFDTQGFYLAYHQIDIRRETPR